MTSKALDRWIALSVIGSLSIGSALASDPLTDNRFSVNIQNADASVLLGLIAAQTGLKLRSEKELGVLVTLTKQNVTAKEILDRLSQDEELDYRVIGNELVVTKRSLLTSGAQGQVHHVTLQYTSASEASIKLMPVVPNTEKLLVDEHSNSIVFIGSDSSWNKISDIISFLDVAPAQILIEARIVETSSEFLRDIGVSVTGNNPSGAQSIVTSNPITQTAAFTYSGTFGSVLDVKLAAAETRGDAKIISRPKVLTLNNQQARIQSGVSINVKTLSTAIANPLVPTGSSSTGTPGLSATTGVTTINAGLTLDILPSIVGNSRIRLVVSINDSQPDTSNEVDGIPAIDNNSASTSILVANGETAIIAGLVKQSNTNTITGVPFLSSIPVLGALFRTTSKADQNNELAIFITPTIDDGHVKVSANAAFPAMTNALPSQEARQQASPNSPLYSPLER